MANDVQIDARSPRFGAAITLALAVTALVLGGMAGAIVLLGIALLFLPGAITGPQATVQAWLFRTLVKPRLKSAVTTESSLPPRFAQQLGLGMSLAGAILGFAGQSWGVTVFAALIVFASFLNSVLNFCLGCQIYLAFKRMTTPKAA